MVVSKKKLSNAEKHQSKYCFTSVGELRFEPKKRIFNFKSKNIFVGRGPKQRERKKDLFTIWTNYRAFQAFLGPTNILYLCLFKVRQRVMTSFNGPLMINLRLLVSCLYNNNNYVTNFNLLNRATQRISLFAN